jgi:hypothetical protein
MVRPGSSRSWRTLIFIVTVVLDAASCTNSTAPLGSEITVQNTTRDTLGYGIADIGTTVTPDRTPLSVGNFSAFGGRVVIPAGTSVVALDELSAYTSRGDLRVIVYDVASGFATYRTQFVITRVQLEQNRFRVELSAANLGPS